ncbi:MAG: hypothetical protein ILP10_00570 [Lachnospiraceae bacterium]|nr:hypothetical protein [Lachnospiraceae bacterium]
MDRRNIPIGGLLLIVAGILVALRAFGIIDFGFWFWIGLVIAGSSLVGMIRADRGRTAYLIGVGIGAILMLRSLGIIRSGLMFPLAFAVVLMYIGIRAIFGKGDHFRDDRRYDHRGDNGYSQDYNGNYGFGGYSDTQGNATQGQQNGTINIVKGDKSVTIGSDGSYRETSSRVEYDTQGNAQTIYSDSTQSGNSSNERTEHANTSAGGSAAYSAIFSGRNITYAGESFERVMLSALFGGINLNLRDAYIRDGAVIDAKVTFGGIDILVPRGVKVVLNCNPVLGGASNKTDIPVGTVNCPVLTINATCVLGGIDVKY